MASEPYMTDANHKDPRVAEILSQLGRFTAGDYSSSLAAAAEQTDEIDSIISGLNKLGDSLRFRESAIRKNEVRIQMLLDVLLKYTVMDFSQRAPVGDDGDEIDALSAGLNALGEEVLVNTLRLQESEEQVNTIFNNAPDAVVVIDSQDVIRRWNPAATRIFGWDEAEVIGKFLHTVLVPDRYRDRHRQGMEHFLRTGEGPILNRTVEFPALRKDQSEVEVELNISVARLKRNYIFISFLRDITARRQAEQKIMQLNATLEQRVHERTEQLHSSEKKYRHLFENNPIPLWVLDVNTFRILDVNDAAVAHYGYSREEFLSMTSLDLRPEEEMERYVALNHRKLGRQNAGVWKHRKKDGTIIDVEVIVHDIVFEGSPARFILANDVTDRIKALEALKFSEGRFRRIFESKMIGFLFWNSTGRITEANDLLLEMLGYTRKDLEEGKMNINNMPSPEYAEAHQVAMKQIALTGVCDPFETEYLRRDGSRLHVMIGSASIEDYSLSGVSFVMDISQRKMMQQEILELNRDLENRIAERTKELVEANKELESFSYSVSHDLRAPLRAIHGYSQMLAEDYEASLDQEGIRLLTAIKFNARQMGQLVDDLLAFSRLGRRALSETIVNLDKLAGDVISDLNPEDKKHTKFILRPLGNARADDGLLRQALQNLISNAVKYSSRKDHPEVEIGTVMTGGQLTYYVRDNGVGFDMAYYNKLFGVFQRLHGSEEFEGTGVGLALTQRIIHRHGGEIWAEARLNEGAVFYFTLSPLATEVS